mgnify:CR=1 FL=1
MDRRASVIVSLLVVGVLALAGCTSPAEPTPSPSVTPVVTSATPSPTPTVTFEERMLAQIPEEAKGDDLLAAVEMAKFFIQLHPGLYQGGDREMFEWLSLPECEFCSSSLEVTEERLAEGIVQVGGDFTIPEQVEGSVIDPETDNTTTALIRFRVEEASFVYHDSAGTVTHEDEGGTYEFSFALRYVNGLWRVLGVGYT